MILVLCHTFIAFLTTMTQVLHLPAWQRQLTFMQMPLRLIKTNYTKGITDMKEKYTAPEMEIITFESEDIITVSEPELEHQ